MQSSSSENHEDAATELQTLKGCIPKDEVSMNLTEAGLLVERSQLISEVYAETLDWGKTKEVWHERRLADRGSRHSSQKIFRILRSRFQAAGDTLPSMPQLSNIYSLCSTERDKAQTTYLFLLNADALIQYTLHELFLDQGTDKAEWDLSRPVILGYLDDFKYKDGSSLDYAGSTKKRWAKGFRSIMKEINVRDSSQSNSGKPPNLGRIPLAVSAGYAWKELGEQWQGCPIGWIYLFQPKNDWEYLFKRLLEEEKWKGREVRNQLHFRPEGDPFELEEKI